MVSCPIYNLAPLGAFFQKLIYCITMLKRITFASISCNMVFRRITEEVAHTAEADDRSLSPNPEPDLISRQKRARHIQDDRLTDFKRVRLVEKVLERAHTRLPSKPEIRLTAATSRLSAPDAYDPDKTEVQRRSQPKTAKTQPTQSSSMSTSANPDPVIYLLAQ
jgi:hypothetical protein